MANGSTKPELEGHAPDSPRPIGCLAVRRNDVAFGNSAGAPSRASASVVPSCSASGRACVSSRDARVSPDRPFGHLSFRRRLSSATCRARSSCRVRAFHARAALGLDSRPLVSQVVQWPVGLVVVRRRRVVLVRRAGLPLSGRCLRLLLRGAGIPRANVVLLRRPAGLLSLRADMRRRMAACTSARLRRRRFRRRTPAGAI